ncbi:hypothetical protein GCM10027414_04450 [Humibacter ginsengiterrae]
MSRSPASRIIGAALAVISIVLAGALSANAANAASVAHTGLPPQAGAPTAIAKARVAAEVLMQSYDQSKAWFPSSWWNSAVALQTIGDYMQRTGDRRFVPELDNTFEKDKGVFPGGVLSGDPLLGNFTSQAIDDSEWWGLTWVQAYDVTGDQKYLDMAETIATYASGFWDTSTCGGGVWWNASKTYKNSVTSGLFIRLTAELHNRIPHDTQWLNRAETAWNWFTGSGLIDSSGLVNDGLTSDCQNNGQTVWSYNQGLAIGGGLELYRATHDSGIMTTVRRLADAAISSPQLVTDGVLTESCDAADATCDDNAKQFKGIFMRYMMDLADTTHDPRYTGFVSQQAASVWNQDRNAGDQFGTRWTGETNSSHPNIFDWRTQASALSALIADIPPQGSKASLSARLSPAQTVVIPAKSGATSISTDLSVEATSNASPAGEGSQQIGAEVTVSAPAGWTATPATTRVVLGAAGAADPASATVPLSVGVPSTAADGDYTVTVKVVSPHLSFTATADILVARTIDFDTGTVAESPWLWDGGHSQSNGVQNRFADGSNYFIYRFPFPTDTVSAQVTLTIAQEYLVQISSNGTDWTTVLTQDQQIHDTSNQAARSIDVTPYLGQAKTVYVRVGDSFPSDGWGGLVSHVSATYSE